MHDASYTKMNNQQHHQALVPRYAKINNQIKNNIWFVKYQDILL